MEQGVKDRHLVKGGFGWDWYNSTIVKTTQNYDLLSQENYDGSSVYMNVY